MSTIEIQERLVFTCPFCSRRAAIVDIVSQNNNPGVTHVAPFCEQFAQLEPHEYLAAVNAKMRERLN
jgi:transcription elongation factor Elf1